MTFGAEFVQKQLVAFGSSLCVVMVGDLTVLTVLCKVAAREDSWQTFSHAGSPPVRRSGAGAAKGSERSPERRDQKLRVQGFRVLGFSGFRV